jgi:preprotein translocase subunit SecD
VATPTASRPGRTLLVLLAITAVMYGLILLAAPSKQNGQAVTFSDKYSPRLGLDLEGGTSVILTPRVAKGEKGKITKDALNQAVAIIRQRVDAFGVAEPEVTTAGNNIVISLPGTQDKDILNTVKQTAELRFRQVILAAAGTPAPTNSPSPSPSPTSSSTASSKKQKPKPSTTTNGGMIPQGLRADGSSSPTPTGGSTSVPTPGSDPTSFLTPGLEQEFAQLDCAKRQQLQNELRKPGADDPKKPLVTCLENGQEKYILAPAEVLGTDVKSASANLEQNGQGSVGPGWEVDLSFTGDGTKKFGDITRRLVTESGDQNRFGIVLDGLVVSAPTTQVAITDGRARITGNFSQQEAQNLANVLKYGALPLTFDPGEVQQVSATLGSNQLHAGLVAGAIGLFLVVLYSFLYYRGLALVTVASLAVAGVLNYGAVVLLGWQLGFRLSLAGIAGLIVAIGITADSFVVYFERLRDEVREGRTLRVAVENGWARARRTIVAADSVSLLAAVVLYALSVGSVRGFAFTLGLTTLIDIFVVFMFTKPLMTLLARTKFYGGGHPWSGLDPVRLGAPRRTLLTPSDRRRQAQPGAATRTGEA